jgi:hypothetical protein
MAARVPPAETDPVASPVVASEATARAAADTNLDTRLDTVEGGEGPLGALQAMPALEVFGHSLAASRTYKPEAWSGRLAAAIDADVWNYGIGGAALYNPDSGTAPTTILDGGWAHFFQTRSMGEVTAGAPYMPGCPVMLWWGNNDIAMLGPGASLVPFQTILRAAIARACCAQIFDDTHSSVTKTGTWNAVTGRVANSGSQAAWTAAGSLSIVVPADFPGGTVDLGFLTPANGDGALLDISVDGGAAVQHDTRNANGFSFGSTRGASGKTGPSVKRLTGLAAGAHTITVTPRAGQITNAWWFDWWGIEPPTLPLVIVGKAERPIDYSLWPNWPYGQAAGLNDADIVDLNTRIQSVVDEFGGAAAGVFTWDPDAVLQKNPVLFDADKAHPNETGLELLARDLFEKLLASPAMTFDRALSAAGRKAIAPHIRLKRSTALTNIASATPTEIDWDTVASAEPSSDLWWNPAKPKEVIVRRGGAYIPSATVSWQTQSLAGQREIAIKRNGSYIEYDRRNASSAGITVQSAGSAKPIQLAAGDVMTVEVTQNSGNNTLAVGLAAEAACVFAVTRVGD